MMRQERQMEHLRIGQERRGRVLPNLLAEPGRGVAVVDGGPGSGVLGPVGREGLEALQLVLGQGLQGEEVQGPAVRVRQEALDDRQVVDQGLAAGRGGGHHHVAAGTGHVPGQGLMGIETGHAHVVQNALHRSGPGPGQSRAYGVLGARGPVADHQTPRPRRALQGGNILRYAVLPVRVAHLDDCMQGAGGSQRRKAAGRKLKTTDCRGETLL